jgi:isorenieratene synthase
MTHISRRTLLKFFLLSSFFSLVGYSRFVKPKPAVYKQDRIDLPRYLDRLKKVVVIGGGLAGLAAAYELSQRGFLVTLLEKSPQLGGKIASWEINVGPEKFKMEHGFHGFFPQYYNLKTIVNELNIKDNFQALNSYSVLFRNETYQPEVFKPNRSAFPWNIIDLAFSSPNSLRWGINLTKISHWKVFQAIAGFKLPDTYYKLDHISVSQWAKNDFPQGLFDLYFLPFAKSTLNAPDVLSVGELLQFFHFYFFGNPEGLAFNATRDDMSTSLVQPIVKSILSKGNNIITEATVNKLNCHEGQIKSVEYYQGSQVSNVPFWVDSNSLLADRKNDYYGAGDRVFAVKKGTDKALSLTCTHQGCTVSRQEDGKFLCPCHGALYDENGKILTGPAKRDLTTYQVIKQKNKQIQLVANTRYISPKSQKIEADYYVIATDVPGVKHLFSLIEGDEKSCSETILQVEKLPLADPFAVGRFWFDRDFQWEHSNFTSLSGYHLTDSITLYHRIQNEYIEWANRTGGSVVELHAYCYKEKEFPNQQALLTTFEKELYEIVPTLKQANILHRELVNQKNFSGYPPHSFGDRPETETQISNLMFAGDWVKMPFPCGLMERAVSSGLLAANSILYQEGRQRRNLLSVNPSGLLSLLSL